jgi:hypothetical protein
MEAAMTDAITRNGELRAKLAELQAREGKNDEAAKPTREQYRAAMAPFEAEQDAIEQAREALLEEYGTEIISTCEGCRALILEGDRYAVCTDGPFLCLECAPTWNDVLRDNQERLDDEGDPDEQREIRESIAAIEGLIAHGRGDDKVC